MASRTRPPAPKRLPAKKARKKPTTRRGTRDPFAIDDGSRGPKIPHAFVLDELESLDPVTKPMFGCRAVYVGAKIVLILRARESPREDDGIWVATETEHHASLRREFPSLRSISIFGPGETKWQNLPVDADDFEESAIRLCALVTRGDPRIGKIPASRRRGAS